MQRTLPFAATCLTAVSLASFASAQFSENFDGYTAGSAIEGQGGWQNWDICATGNQAFNTVSAAQATSGANSLRMVGANGGGGGCNLCSDTTHELNGPYTSGQWTVKVNIFIPNGFAGDAYVILLNTYGNCGGPYNWSTQIRFDDLGMVIVDNLGNNVAINGNQPYTFDQWGELKMEIDLDNNTAIYSYNNVEMFSAEWATTGLPELAAMDLFPFTDDTTEWFVDDISVEQGIVGGPVGTNYCTAVANSTGTTGVISGSGSASIANNDLTLIGSDLPPVSFGFFIIGEASAQVANPGGSSGNLCVGTNVGRYVGPGQIQNSGPGGVIQLLIDNTMTPTPTGLVALSAGDTRFFQLWHRDQVGGMPTSNFSDGLRVMFF